MCMYMYMCKHVPFILLFSGDFACELFVIVDVRVFSQTCGLKLIVGEYPITKYTVVPCTLTATATSSTCTCTLI